MIDADPNHPIASWAKGTALPNNLSIVADVDEDNILDWIEEAAASTPFVIVDLEGTALAWRASMQIAGKPSAVSA